METAIDITLLDSRPQKVPTNIHGPITINGQTYGALLLGRSSSGIQGLFILPGVIDADYTGVISIVLQTNFPPIHVPAGSRIAQLVPVPQLTKDLHPCSEKARQNDGFGSTGGLTMLTMAMNQRPVMRITMENYGHSVHIEALFDTGADLTIVSQDRWPESWPLVPTTTGVEGVGGSTSVRRSRDRVTIIIDGRTTTAFVTVMSLPQGVQALVGRDVLDQMGVILTTDKHFQWRSLQNGLSRSNYSG